VINIINAERDEIAKVFFIVIMFRYYNFNELSSKEIKKLDELVFLIDEHKRKESENIFALFINIRY
jgi:hypothetical protein